MAAGRAKIEKNDIWHKYPLITHVFCFGLILYSIKIAFDIRTYALKDYGYVIHEFDPWFNYRATEYLDEHGIKEFFQWYDHRSWFPIGRPVGTTIYPGMQLTAVFLKDMFQNYGDLFFLPSYNLASYTLNDICCLMPCWFGVLASLLTGLMSYESSRSLIVGALGTFFMAVIPAHIMRSVGGGYDNESVAVTAMTLTFYLWVKSLATDQSTFVSFIYGVLTGLAYVYMVAAWGGYIFVLNMISFHAFYLSFRSKYYSIFTPKPDFSFRVFISFSCFYIIGTLGAIQIPIVGLSPLKSLEQLFGLVALLVTASVAFCQYMRRQRKQKPHEYYNFVFRFCIGAGIVALGIIALLYPTGYFGPLTARIRGLFIPHSRTGNPLVDSVAEHRATSPSAYVRYLHACLLLGPIGFLIMLLNKKYTLRDDQNKFFILYAFWGYYFSSKMVRLMILLGPIVSILSAIAIETILNWSLNQLLSTSSTEKKPKQPEKLLESKKSKRKKGKKVKNKQSDEELVLKEFNEMYNENSTLRKVVSTAFILSILYFTPNFLRFCHKMAERSSHPSIMFKAKNRLGQEVIVDDYKEAYWWLRDNTPQDSRVLAWWDYGYQIAGIGRRITIADGNTWNHEHIATLGKCLVSNEEQGHEMITHLADYVLLWAGGGGDDLGKSPHIARIANSVYNDLCGVDDPLCTKFGFQNRDRSKPLDMMKESTIYKLYSRKHDKKKFELAYESVHKKVVIYKVLDVDMESRNYSFNENNYLCDESGWLCRGQYPPKFRKFMTNKKDFAQLENFNVDKSKDGDEYQKQYHKAFGKNKN